VIWPALECFNYALLPREGLLKRNGHLYQLSLVRKDRYWQDDLYWGEPICIAQLACRPAVMANGLQLKLTFLAHRR
jgi:hypothetical protein